ncbi:MAG: hypothetical protein GWO23_16235, partial [Gammaproteobacteria bacterium]|nr:hypothetical protein [Gammaproteobacteria bacterium]
MNIVKRSMLLFLFGWLISSVWGQPVMAQSADLPVLSNEVVVDFPNTATFRLELDNGVTLADAMLTYQLG